MFKRGFILVIVLGLLGILAFVSVVFVRTGTQNKFLTDKFVLKVRANLLALSGYDYSSLNIQSNPFFFYVDEDLPVSSKSEYKKSISVLVKGLNARININDGIKAGELEILQDPLFNEYDASALDPWPNNDIEAPYLDHNPRARSALINLRIRRLLNAYGEVHRFVGDVYDGDYRRVANTSYYQQKLPDPVFVTHHSADEMRGRSLVSPDPNENQGLGDLIIGFRPQKGYVNVEEIKPIIDQWAVKHLNSHYPPDKLFYELIRDDLTVISYEDDRFFRLQDERVFGDFAKSAEKQLGEFDPKDLQLNPLNMEDLWRHHSVPLINLSHASFYVRAATFYAPTNVSYSVEGASTIPPYNFSMRQNLIFDENTAIESMMLSPSIGVAPPIFDPSKSNIENGFAVGRKNHLMSLRDAMLLAHNYEEYLDEEVDGLFNQIRNFDEFSDFLLWHEQKSSQDSQLQFERVLKDNPYQNLEPHDFDAGGLFYISTFEQGGIFLQDYVRKTLPHILSCVRRIPGYLGAPAALMSPYMVVKPNLSDATYLSGGVCKQGFYKVEDFVWRFTHPKVCFLPCGYASVTSQGELKSFAGEVLSKSTVRSASKLFETSYLRTQKDFIDIHDAVQVGQAPYKYKFGPEFFDPWDVNSFPQRPTSPSTYLGFVGLRDYDSDEGLFKIDYDFLGQGNFDEFTSEGYDPQIIMQFHPWHNNENASLGFYNDSDVFNHLEPQDRNDQWAREVGQDARGLLNSAVEGADISLMADGRQHDGFGDLSPFNGIRLSGMNHGEYATDIFNDSLYWRLDDWLDSSLPIGEMTSAGVMTFWFQLPCGYDYPTPVMVGGVRVIPDSFTRILVSLNLWEKYEFTDTLVPPENEIVRPVAINVGLKRTQAQGLCVFARYDSGGETHQNDVIIPYLGPSPYDEVNLVSATHDAFPEVSFLGFWAQGAEWRDPITYNVYRYVAHRSSEVSVRFKNQKECGPGSWHRASVFWNLKYSANDTEPQQHLYLDLHDSTNKSDEYVGDFNEFRQAVSMAPPLAEGYESGDLFDYPRFVDYETSPEQSGAAGFLLPFDSLMTLSLGETQARRLEGYSFSGRASEAKKYYPFWRLNSVIDNFRLYMGPSDNSTIPDKYLGPDYLQSTFKTNKYGAMRYEVRPPANPMETSMEPAWEFQPEFLMGGKLLAIGTRIYYPPDSRGNVPYVWFFAGDGGMGLGPIYRPEWHLNEKEYIPKNEQDFFFPSFDLDPWLRQNFRIVLKYMAHKPSFDKQIETSSDSGMLKTVGDDLYYLDHDDEQRADHMTDIPWIKELSFRYISPQSTVRLSWELN